MLFLNRQASIGELKNSEFWSEFYSGWYEREVEESFKQGFTSPCKNFLKCFFLNPELIKMFLAFYIMVCVRSKGGHV